jgi:hypothetical protein
MKFDLFKQIDQSKQDHRKLKQTCPYLFPEYINLIEAKKELELARVAYKQAQAAWKKIGN